MQILEHGQAQERTLLFFPCTAEPVWAFADTITLLSQRWHVFQVVYDGPVSYTHLTLPTTPYV